MLKKQLTNKNRYVIISKLSAEMRKDVEKSIKKFFKKLSKKCWQKKKSVIYSLSCLREGIAIGPWKLNNEIRKGTRDSMVKEPSEEFLKSTFQTVIRKLKLAKYKNNVSNDEWANKALKMILTRKCYKTIFREFDPGSGRTLAACLTHASRTKHLIGSLRSEALMT